MGHVYLLRADRRWRGKNLVKIGRTNKPDVYDRISQIQHEWRHERNIHVDRIHSVIVQDSAAVESALHHKFKAPIRLYGKELKQKFGQECNGDTEWFGMTDNQFKEAIEAMNQYATARSFSSQYEPDHTPWLGIAAVIGIVLIGWSMVTRSPSPQVKAPTTAIVLAPVNIRKGPSVKTAKVGTLPKGRSVPVLEVKDGWFRIDNGQWIAGIFAKVKGVKK